MFLDTNNIKRGRKKRDSELFEKVKKHRLTDIRELIEMINRVIDQNEFNIIFNEYDYL